MHFTKNDIQFSFRNIALRVMTSTARMVKMYGFHENFPVRFMKTISEQCGSFNGVKFPVSSKKPRVSVCGFSKDPIVVLYVFGR